ncbi:MAG: hypothetical protein OER56_11680 [Hyphomicrobiales bacterium]|nr:hypothetical protein [Hyphomicrobiales bacterium]
MKSALQGQDRRINQRSRCLKGARIVFGNGNSTLACRIRNQSETGMRLTTNETGYVPETFALVPDGALKSQVCRVTWRSPTEIGAVVVADAPLSQKGYNRSNPLIRMRKSQIAERYPV